MMRVPELKVWIPVLGPEPAQTNVIGCTLANAARVAVEEVQDHWCRLDHYVGTLVHVRDEDGKLRVFDVTAEEKWTYTAREVRVTDE